MSSVVGRGAAPPASHPGGPRRARQAPPFAAVHHLIEAQAGRTPGAVAVSCGGRRMSYRELNDRADRLARRLRAAGVGPEVLVALCVERSPEMVVGLLAVLKAGGSYVPLDPAYPADRLAMMLEDSGAPVVLTQESLRDGIPYCGVTVLCLDGDDGAVRETSARRPAPRARADGLAYVIYTSGSTGRPKGVQVTHGNLTNFLVSMRRILGINDDDALLAVTTLSFDIAALELFLPLTVGARVEVLDRDSAADGSRLAARLDREGITFLQATPATWRILLDSGWEGRPSLTLLCGGEALPRELADRLLPRGKALWNLYGPTETTVWSSAERVAPGDGPVSIGRPIANTRLYVLDGHFQPVPIGVVGELYIGGAGVARGYLGRPGLTAERFLPDPFGGRPGARLYRTGDLARWRPDGRLECLGRVDHQVKVRGFRVELGEVEAALAAHPAVRQAVASAWTDPTGEQALVAYVVPEAGTPAPPAAELRPFLKASLPDYMIPSAFVELTDLPLTPNGKVDRKALPAPETARQPASRAFIAPRTPAEETVAAVWAEVLRLDRIGADDHFFDLGGHSLLATQVVSRLRAAFETDLPVRALFEAPTVAELAARLESARRGGRRWSAPPLRPVPRGGPIPLSFAQQALWYLDQLAPGQPTFNVVAAARVLGRLDVSALERALNEMVRRHESLRTTFETVDGRPVQVIAPALELSLRPIDLTALPAERRQAEAERLATEEARRNFDLGRGPLVHATLIRLSEEELAVVLVMHHVITDGWSFGVAVGELSALYDAFRRGEPSPLPDLPIRYADYAVWQREWLAGEVLDELLGYWRRRLDGVPALELPTDRPRPAVRGMRGASLGFTLAPGLSDALRDLGRREGATPFMTLLAAFHVLLGRYSGQHDFAVGTPVANRNRPEVEGLIGYFVNMLALRADLSGDPTFRDLLGRVREEAIGAFEHQELPLELLLEATQPDRDTSRTPLFQVMFVLQNNQAPDVAQGGLTLEGLADGGTGTAKFDLTLTMADSPEGFHGSMEYRTDLFDEATVGHMLHRFQTLLEGIAAGPDRPVSELPLLTGPERDVLTREWAGEETTSSATACVHTLFEQRVREAPQDPAVVVGRETLTYGELNRRANRLARRLVAAGVGPEVLVGVRAERLSDVMTGVLAVLKAGGAYLPIDPAVPRSRLRQMTEGLDVRFLLTGPGLRDEPKPAGMTVIEIDRPTAPSSPADEENPAGRALPENLAYLISTSGSTGAPKGVAVPHAGLANVYRAWESAYRLRAGTRRHLQVASYSFDVFTGEWVRALCSGAALVACPRDILLDPGALFELMKREGVDCAEFVPVVAEGLIPYLEAQGLSLDFLKLLAVGSDTWHAGVYERLRRLVGPSGRVVNSYGLTEATVDSTYFEGDLSGLPDDRPVPIGRPFPGARVYVLDRHLHPAPLGVPGELYVGGDALARGYDRQPRLTAERFLPDPFSGRPGSRMYRTGDLARWRPDGLLELTGRADHQVKVRGFRVELGDVESALLRCPAVRDAVVTVRDAGADGKSLVAYVVPDGDSAVRPEDVRRSLKDRLPRYMIPSSVVILAALPTTPSGKVDRSALPEPSPADDRNSGETVAPRDEIEAALVPIWEEVLGVQPVGVTDDFFDLGGHSLVAVRLAARVEDRLGKKVPLSAFLLGSTIEDLAALLREPERNGAAASPLVDLGARGPGRPLVLVHPVGGGVLCYKDLASEFDGDRPVFGIQAVGLEAGGATAPDLVTMAASYVAAVREAQPEGPYHLAGWSLGGVIAFEMARQLWAEGHEVATLALIDSASPAPGVQDADELTVLASFLTDLARLQGKEPRLSQKHRRRLIPGARPDWEALLAGAAPDLVADLGPERLRRHFEVFRANLRALAGYDPRPYPGRVVLFRADRNLPGALDDPALGWGRLAAGGVSVHNIAGDHYTLLRPPTVEDLARALMVDMSRPAAVAETGVR